MQAIKILFDNAKNMNDISKELARLANEYETADFLNGDPSWFMHQVKGQKNQEVMGLIASSLSYGNRKLFMPKVSTLLEMSKGEPYEWVSRGGYKSLVPDNAACFYRLQSNHNVRELLRGIEDMISQHGSIGKYVSLKSETGIEAVDAITAFFSRYDTGHMIPINSRSCCKRVCMYLRWMVRQGSPVDLGVWTFIDSRTLIIPMDTHVVSEAIRMGLTKSKSTTMMAAIRLTETLKATFPDDPLKGDFALFGYGIANAERQAGNKKR